MANYLITNCGGGTVIVDSGESSLMIGDTYYLDFTGETSSSCYTINSETSDPADDTISIIVSSYDNCLECLQNNEFSFLVTACTVSDLGGPVNPSQFNEWPIGNFYKLCANNGEFDGCLCFEVVGILESIYPFTFTILGPYSDCECEIPPRSANTETFICVTDCEFTGSTAVSPPHPVWTDGYGTPVTQLNMVLIGSGNGLNG